MRRLMFALLCCLSVLAWASASVEMPDLEGFAQDSVEISAQKVAATLVPDSEPIGLPELQTELAKAKNDRPVSSQADTIGLVLPSLDAYEGPAGDVPEFIREAKIEKHQPKQIMIETKPMVSQIPPTSVPVQPEEELAENMVRVSSAPSQFKSVYMIKTPYASQEKEEYDSVKEGEAKEILTPRIIADSRKEDGLEIHPDYMAATLFKQGERMSDDFLVPGRASALALLPSAESGEIILMCAHNETRMGSSVFNEDSQLRDRVSEDLMYDKDALGAVTRLRLKRATGEAVAQNLSMVGLPNTGDFCAMGWNALLSVDGLSGSVVDVSAAASLLQPAVGLDLLDGYTPTVMLADQQMKVIYFATDEPIKRLYRFRPHLWSDLSTGGSIEVLCIRNWPAADSRNIDEGALPIQKGGYYGIYWQNAKTSSNAVRFGEISAMTLQSDSVYFATRGSGATQAGQLFELAGDQFRLVEEFAGEDIANPTALCAYAEDSFILAMAPRADRPAVVYLRDPHASYSPILALANPKAGKVDSIVVDPFSKISYLSVPQQDRVLIVKHSSLGD